MKNDAPPASGTADPKRVIQAIEARSTVYAVLARGFSFPDGSVIEFFSGCGAEGASDAGELGSRLAELIETARESTPDEIHKGYIDIFDPVGGPFPYETEHKEFADDFSKAHLLADVMGFYRAFGVEPRSERADEISSELEFMHFLTLKEGLALHADRHEDATVCRDAQVKFFGEHLGAWAESFLDAIQPDGAREPAPFYKRLFGVFRLFIEIEKEELH